MKKITLFLAFLFTTSVFAQQAAFEKAPGLPDNSSQSALRDTFNLQFQFPTAAFIGEYGIESDGQFIYVTQWLDDSIAKYDLSGNVLDVFVIPGAGQIRDLAWDGTYFYGSPNDYMFYILDMENKTLVGTLNTDMRIRGMAYDGDTDALWVSEHWSPMFYRLDKNTGTTLDTFSPSGITMDAISGLAYDNQSPGGPFLWGFSQDSTGAIIIKYDIPNQAQTGNMIDVSGLATGAAYAGGLFIEPMNGMPGITIGGMIQNDQVFALELGYANLLVGMNDAKQPELRIYPNPVKDALVVELGKEGTFLLNVLNMLGQVVMSREVYLSPNTTMSLETSGLDPGVYILRLTGRELNLDKSFVVSER